MANRSMSPLDLTFEDDLVIDLDLWEVVNASDGQYSSDDDSYTLSDDDVISLDDNDSIVIPPPPIVQDLDLTQRKRIVRRYPIGITYGDLTNRGGCVDDDEGEEEEEDGEYDLEDEIMPRSVSKKLGKGRVRKVGKKAIKKVPYSYLKSGCVRPGGKLGLGLKLRF